MGYSRICNPDSKYACISHRCRQRGKWQVNYILQSAKESGHFADNLRRVSEDSCPTMIGQIVPCVLPGARRHGGGCGSTSEASCGHVTVSIARTDRVSEKPPSRYRAFILRLWQDDTNQGWRFSLEEIGRSLPRRGFHSLHALTAFIEAELQRPQQVSGEQPAADHVE